MSEEIEDKKGKSVYNLRLHEIIECHEPPYYRIMRVPAGWLYNFYDVVKDEYSPNWIFTPFVSIKNL